MRRRGEEERGGGEGGVCHLVGVCVSLCLLCRDERCHGFRVRQHRQVVLHHCREEKGGEGGEVGRIFRKDVIE